MGKKRSRIMTATVAAGVSLLLLTGCAPSSEQSDSTDKVAEETTKATEKPAKVELDDPSAKGPYGTRWVNEFGLPKIRNYEINAVIDQSEASGYTTVTAGGGLADQAVIDEYGDLLESMGWSHDGVRKNAQGEPQEDWHLEGDTSIKSISVISVPVARRPYTKFTYAEVPAS